MPDQGLPQVITLMGPTASGKSALGLELARRFPCEIVNVDSAQVYRGLDIGSAKPSLEERKEIPHHLLDIRDPGDQYSAADFCRDVAQLLPEILERGRTPLLVGGTMLYFKALLEGLSDLPAADESVRAQIEKEAEQKGWPCLHAELAKVDPQTADKLHPNHSQRIARALEVFRVSGKPMSELQAASPVGDKGVLAAYTVCQLAIAPRDRFVLHERISRRFQQMLDAGFVDEVRRLFSRGDLNLSLPALRSVGYRQVWEYLEGRTDYSTMVEKGIVATRQLAKRQFTWLRNWQGINWVYTQEADGNLLEKDEILLQALNFLSKRSI